MNFGALKSKTVWFGVLQVLVPVVQAALTGDVPQETIALALTGVVTILLRAVTDKPLSDK